MRLRVGLGALLGLFLLGRFLPGPAAWGFNHLAFLPGWMTVVWALAALALLLPRTQEKIAGALCGPVPHLLFAERATPWVLTLLASALFIALREQSYFMGDGYLVGELVERGVRFRGFDSLDFLLHARIWNALSDMAARPSPFTIYRLASGLAGLAAIWIHLSLVSRLPWAPWRKAAAFLILFWIGPGVFFFGYVESYSFLFVFVTAFLLSGLLVLEGLMPLWIAAGIFGVALAFNLTAVFSAPALVLLAWRAPARPAARRWAQAVIPPALFLLLAAAIHLLYGFNDANFHKEFLESRNAQSIWVPLGQQRGLLTFYHWKDLFNLALITAPAALIVVLANVRRLRSRAAEPAVLFLLAQIVGIAVLSLFLDRKLGGARDWDLLGAHAAGLALLAVLLLPAREAAATPDRSDPPAKPRRAVVSAAVRSLPDPIVGLVLGVCLLTFGAWVVLLHLEARSINRFLSVCADFPSFPRAYAYEEVGKYYRKAATDGMPEDSVRTYHPELMARAQEMYERCVATYPSNPRFHVLLGSIYFVQEKYDQAGEQYRQAYQSNPSNAMAVEMLGKLAIHAKDFGAGLEWFKKLVALSPTRAGAWELYGYTAYQANQIDLAIQGFKKVMEFDPSRNFWPQVGAALFQRQQFLEAADAFRRAIAAGAADASIRNGLAYCLVDEATEEVQRGRPLRPEWIEEAEQQAKLVQGSDPSNSGAIKVLQQISLLRNRAIPKPAGANSP